MAYWGAGPVDTDYADGVFGASVLTIQKKMFEDMRSVIQEGFPEQSMIAHLCALRMIAERFPNVVSFDAKNLAEAERLFRDWYIATEKKIPAKYREELKKTATAEFAAFRKLLRIEGNSGTDY